MVDIRQGPEPERTTTSRPILTAVGDVLLFHMEDDIHGDELWRSDGTAAGTRLVEDIAPDGAGSNPTNLVDVGGILFFIADDGTHGDELWKSDGTDAGTVLVRDIVGGRRSPFPNFTPFFDFSFTPFDRTLVLPRARSRSRERAVDQRRYGGRDRARVRPLSGSARIGTTRDGLLERAAALRRHRDGDRPRMLGNLPRH